MFISYTPEVTPRLKEADKLLEVNVQLVEVISPVAKVCESFINEFPDLSQDPNNVPTFLEVSAAFVNVQSALNPVYPVEALNGNVNSVVDAADRLDVAICIRFTPGCDETLPEVIVIIFVTNKDPDITSDPVISALPLLIPFHPVETIPVSPEPFPTNDPENIDPDIADTPVKFTIDPDPDTISDPVICALPFLIPFHAVVGRLVRFAPLPLKEPVKDCAVTDCDTNSEPDIVTVLAVKSPPINGLPI